VGLRQALSEEDYQALLEYQHYRCAICGKPVRSLDKRLAVDHDHLTGEIRGLACAACNWTIGYLHEDVQWFKAAASYLEHPPSRACWDEEPRWWPGSPGAAGHDLRGET
jgi:DNA-directed RNA polymerase subunit RPC12/RpoP